MKESSYILSKSDEEASRLAEQALLIRDSTQFIFDQIGLKSGMHCLDAGCGTGDAMRLMGEKVGASGEVTGVDIDGDMGKSAIQNLESTCAAEFSFIEGDIAEVDLPGRYDIVLCRLLLVHVKDPVGVLKKLWGSTKRGGYLVVQDVDFCDGVSNYLPSDSMPLKRFWDIILDVGNKANMDARIGMRLPNLLVSAGIGLPDDANTASYFRPLGSHIWWYEGLLSSLSSAILGFGIASKEEIESVVAGLHEDAKRGVYVSSAPVIGVWKRK